VLDSASLAVSDILLRGAPAAMNRHNQTAKSERSNDQAKKP
jgi:hypothetical protein